MINKALNKILSVLLLFLLAGNKESVAQVAVTSSDSLVCGVSCTNLTAHVVGYPSTTSGITSDDAWSSVISIGFPFNFYGVNYNQCIIGSNGLVGFNISNAGSYNTWLISNTLLATPSSAPDIGNTIAGAWCDMLISAGGTINYAIAGTTPNRKFVVNFCGDHMYSCTAQWTTAQVVLYETSNIIEVHIAHKTICAGWNNGRAICGVVNATGTAATTAPGRDFPATWNADYESWRFTPTGGGSSYTVTSIPYASVPALSSTIYWYNATTGAYIGSGATINVCPATATTYRACALGCADTSSGYYTVTPLASMTPITWSNLYVCAGQTTYLSDATPGGTWSSASTGNATVSSTGVVTGVAAGTAVISYSISGGCVATCTVTVSAIPPITGSTSMCSGSTITLSDPATGGIWSSASTSIATVSTGGVVSGIAGGTAVISYTFYAVPGPTGGCAAQTTVTVTPQPLPIIGNAVCQGYSVTLSDPTPGGTWSCTPASMATIDPGTGIISGIVPGSVTVTYSTGSGCTITGTVTVLPSPGIATISGPTVVCTGNTITLSASASGGVWSSSATGIATISPGGVVTSIAAGAVTISYTIVTISCGSAVSTYHISVEESPNAGTISGPSIICGSGPITLSDNSPGGIWGSSNTSVATVTGGVVTGGVPGTAIIAYVVTNSCGTASTTFTVTVGALPATAPITGEPHLCTGAFYTYHDSVSGGVWSCNDTSVAGIDAVTGRVFAHGAGTVLLTYTTGPTAGGCYSVATYTLTVTTGPTFTVNSTEHEVSCNGDENGSIAAVVSGGIPPLHYLWSTGSTDTMITGLGPGVYGLNINEPVTQCLYSNSYTITEPDSLVVTDTATMDLCKTGTGTIQLHVSGGVGGYTYLWSTGNTGAAMEHLHSGVYTVTVTDTNHCAAIHAATVEDNYCGDIIVYDVITPNGDGINDVWVIEGITNYAKNTVQVADKWGDVVFERTNYQNDWNGAGKNGPLPDGTYYYLVQLNEKNAAGGSNTFTGTLLIKR